MDKVIIRIVIVEFNDDAKAADVIGFESWLKSLAERLPYVQRMRCGSNIVVPSEQTLSAVAPSAKAGQYASVWEFASKEDLSRFIEDPLHQHFAATRFKSIVKYRTVASISSD